MIRTSDVNNQVSVQVNAQCSLWLDCMDIMF